jgi:hypothetical protein
MTMQAGRGTAGGSDALRSLAASLGDSDRDRAVAGSTRRVVMASMGVMRDQQAVRKRSRSLALAAIVVVLLAIGPLAWLVVDYFSSGGHLGDVSSECGLWLCIVCPAVLAAGLVAGWLRKR